MYHLEFPIEPYAKGRPRFSKTHCVAYTPAPTRSAEAELRFWMFQKWHNELKKTPLEGAIHIIARFIFARPKSVSEKKRKFYTIKPDIDNVAKAIFDAGNGIIWKDDAQIVAASFFKDYGDTAKVFLSIKEVI